MNILILCDGFPPISNAGAEKMAYLIAKEYKNNGYEVTVITTSQDLTNGEIYETKFENIKIFQIGSNYNNYFRAYVSLYNHSVLKSVCSILDEYKFDFVHLHNIHQHISYSVIGILKKYKLKMMLTLHDAMSVDYGKFTQGINQNDLSETSKVKLKLNPFITFLNYKRSYNPFRNIIIKYFLLKVDKLVAVSSMQKEFLEKNGIKNIVVVHNGTEDHKIVNEVEIIEFKNRHGITNKDKIILFTGRISLKKGVYQVEDMLKLLVSKNKNTKLVIAGSNYFPFRDEKLKNHVIMTGWISYQEVQIINQIANVVIVPSICYDMFANVVVEGLRAGVPVVISSFVGAKELIKNNKMGQVINPFNAKNFANSVNYYLKIKCNYSYERKQFYKENCTMRICFMQYNKIIKEII